VYAFAAAVGTVAALVALPAPAAEPSELLAFTRNERVYFINPQDGSGLVRAPLPRVPSWSSDGRKLAYYIHENQARLYVANGDGTKRRSIFRRRYYCLEPEWSPDARKIVFVSDCDFDFMEVHVINADGTRHKNLTPKRWAADPEWAPDGRSILYTNMRPRFDFRRRPAPAPILYAIDPNGRTRRPIKGKFPFPFASRLGIGPGTRWSRDGKRIFFIAEDGLALSVINRNGTGFRRLTPPDITVGDFELSPDGRLIAVVGAIIRPRGARDIYIVNSDGTGFRRLTDARGHDMSPTWSPDSRKIAFQSLRDGNWEIYVMNADGTDQRNLTRSPSQDESPVWRPRK